MTTLKDDELVDDELVLGGCVVVLEADPDVTVAELDVVIVLLVATMDSDTTSWTAPVAASVAYAVSSAAKRKRPAPELQQSSLSSQQ